MKLPRTIRDRQGNALRTRDDARRYVLDKLEVRPTHKTWRHAAELLLDKASSPEAIASQIELALLMDVQLASERQ